MEKVSTPNKENSESYGPKKNIERCLRRELDVDQKPKSSPWSEENRRKPPTYIPPNAPSETKILAESKLCLVTAFPNRATKDFVYHADKKREEDQQQQEKQQQEKQQQEKQQQEKQQQKQQQEKQHQTVDYLELANAPRLHPEDRRYYRAIGKMQHVPGVVTLQFNNQTQQPLKPVPYKWEWTVDNYYAKLRHERFDTLRKNKEHEYYYFFDDRDSEAPRFVEYKLKFYKRGIIDEYLKAVDSWLERGINAQWDAEQIAEFNKIKKERKLLKNHPQGVYLFDF